MVIYLVRHPETKRNAEGKLGGWERCEYSELGKKQFDKIFEYFSNINLPVYSSDLPRAKLLAEKMVGGKDINLTIDERLREVNCRETRPYDSYETDEELGERVKQFLKNDIEDCIVVSHAGAVRWIVTMLCGKEDGEGIRNIPRDTIFKIETVKNENKLSVIQT